jgi:AcrR family transcriptional regulator
MPRSTSKPERPEAGPAPGTGTRAGVKAEAEALIESARSVLERRGGDGFTVHEVLSEAGLGTRAFYRHFASKEALVLAVFASAAAREAERLRERMRGAETALAAVTAWLEARLELAFDDQVASTMKGLSLEAQRAIQQSPDQMEAAFDCMLAPLTEQLRRGQLDGSLAVTDPGKDAQALHDVIWGETLRRWSGFPAGTGPGAQDHVLGFCLRAIGADLEPRQS